MKILIVTNVYPTPLHPYHGIFVAEQVESLCKLYPDLSFDIFYIDGLGGKWNYIKSIWEIRKKVNNSNYDLIHIHYGLSGMYMLSPFVKKVKTIVTFHGSDIQPKGGNGKLSLYISRFVAKHSDYAIVLNDNMNSMVLPYCSNTVMIPCAVNISTFTPRSKDYCRDSKLIIFPSSPKRQVKNYPLFAETISILKNKYKVNVEEYHLENMSRQQIASLYCNADVLLMTSNSEGSPQSVKEAMACNLSCVSTPVGDVKYLFEGVKGCCVSENHSPDELSALVMKVLNNQVPGIEPREKIIKLQLDESSISKRIYELYQQVCI